MVHPRQGSAPAQGGLELDTVQIRKYSILLEITLLTEQKVSIVAPNCSNSKNAYYILQYIRVLRFFHGVPAARAL